MPLDHQQVSRLDLNKRHRYHCILILTAQHAGRLLEHIFLITMTLAVHTLTDERYQTYWQSRFQGMYILGVNQKIGCSSIRL